ncbi:hypothetical protein [Chamaesiphon sp. VAR_48_metabat_403]|uniref:hypothetical protein n=1 Tax=Chamaesiphon sp. VAR_48_metabat_403 TaxID=2964700 RepID=UPI00286DB248|nr:hypothetical protein [Chamaesiphon sp. VAR_48_metabat_403]
MSKIELRTNPVWQDLTNILETIDSEALIKEHLELCEYKVCGYWDERDIYHEEINLPRTLQAALASGYVGLANVDRFLQLKYYLKIADLSERSRKIGEVVLIYDENLDFIDENWAIDIDFLS